MRVPGLAGCPLENLTMDFGAKFFCPSFVLTLTILNTSPILHPNDSCTGKGVTSFCIHSVMPVPLFFSMCLQLCIEFMHCCYNADAFGALALSDDSMSGIRPAKSVCMLLMVM